MKCDYWVILETVEGVRSKINLATDGEKALELLQDVFDERFGVTDTPTWRNVKRLLEERCRGKE